MFYKVTAPILCSLNVANIKTREQLNNIRYVKMLKIGELIQ